MNDADECYCKQLQLKFNEFNWNKRQNWRIPVAKMQSQLQIHINRNSCKIYAGGHLSNHANIAPANSTKPQSPPNALVFAERKS